MTEHSPEITHFEPLVGTRFRTSEGPDPPVELELIEVRPLRPPYPPGPGERLPFALLFRYSGDETWAQSIVSLQHDTLGALSLFLVPIGREPEGLLLEAVFG